jgi:hypothetical protein
MSAGEKLAAIDFRTFSSCLIAFIDAYRHRFWGETGAVLEP